jgi:hypothetical protein
MKKSVLAAVVMSALGVCGAQARSVGAEAAFEASRPASMSAAFERSPSLPGPGVEGSALQTAALERQPARFSGNDWVPSATAAAPSQQPGTYGLMFLGLLIIGALVRQRCINQD